MIAPTDQIVAAWGEQCRRSSLIVVIVRDPATGELREEVIQPEEHTRDMSVLLNASTAAAESMRHAVKRWQQEQRRKHNTADFEPPGENTVTVGDLIGLRRV